jgi:hypothetical protein
MPFLDALQRDIHFAKHGREFGAADAMEYERMADAFMFDPITADIGECTRRNGRDRLRFGYTSHHFGVACTGPVFLRTFHIVGAINIASHGGTRGYFQWQCGRIM